MSEPNTNSHQDNKTPSSSSSCLRFTRPTLRPTNGATTTTTSDNAATCQASHLSLTTSSSSSLVTPSTSDGSPSRRYSEVTLARHASSTATGSATSSSPQPLPMPHTTSTTTTTSNISSNAATGSNSTAAVPTVSSPPPQLSASVLSVEEYPRRECPTSHDNNNTTTKGTTEHTLMPSCSETTAEECDKSATRRHTAGAQLSCSTSLVPTPMSVHKTTHNITTSSSNSHALFMQGQTSMCEEAGTHVCTGTDTDLASTGLYALSAHTSVETSSLPMTCHDERDGAASTTHVETSSTTAVTTTTAITQPITITVVPTTTTTTSSHNNNSSTTRSSNDDAGDPVVQTAMMSTSNELTGHTAWMTRAEDKPHTSYCSPSHHHHNKDNKEEEGDVESAGCSPRSFLSRTVPASGSSGDAMVSGYHVSSSSGNGGRQAVHDEAEHDIVNTPMPTHCVTSSTTAAVNDDNDVTRHAARVSHNTLVASQDKHEESKACSDATDLQPSAACAEMTTSDSPTSLQQPQQPAESATCVANSISSSDCNASSSVTATTSAVSRLRRRAPALTIVTALPSDYTNNSTPHDTPITTTVGTSNSNAATVVRASATLLPNTGSSTAVAEGDEAVAQSQPWHGASCDTQQQRNEEEGRRVVMREREGGESSTLTPNASQQHHNSSSSNSSHGTAHATDAVPSSGLVTTTTTQPLSSASHAQPHYVTHHPSVNTIIIPAHNITINTSSNMGSAALPPLLLQTHTTTTTSNAQHAQTQRAALYAEREPSLSACGTPFTSSPAVLSCRSSTPRTTTSVASSTTNTTSMYSARSARYSHYRRGATLTTQGGTAATMLHGHHYCYYPTLTLREWFPQLPASLRLSRERVYVHRSRERQLGKGAYGVVMLGQLYPPRTSVQAEREAGWSGYDMSRCCGGGDGAARTNANATTVVITAPVEGNNSDTGGGDAEKTKSAAGGGGERRQGNGEVRSGTDDVTVSSHTTHNNTTTTKTAVAVGDVMPMHQQPYSKYTVAFYDCGPQPFLTNFATRKTTTIMSTTADTSRRSHVAAVHDVTSPSSLPQQEQQHEEAQALIASPPPPPPSSASLLRKSEGTVQGSSSSSSGSRVSGRQAQLHRALTLSLPHNTHDVENDSEKKEEDGMGPTQPITPTMTTPSATHDSVATLDSNNNNKQSVTVTEATRQQTLPQQFTSPALPPCEEMTSTHITTTSSISDGVPHTTTGVTTAPSSSSNNAVVVGHETGRTQQYSSPAIPRMPLGVTTQRPLASPQLSSALSLDTTVPSMTPTTNNSSSSSSPLLWLPTTTTTTTSTTTSTTNTRKSSAAAVLRASQLVRQSSPPLTFPALRRSPSLHGLTETTTPTNTATTSVGLMSTRPQTTTSASSVAAVTMMSTRGGAATTTTTHVPLVTSSTITTSNAAIVAASALRTQRSPAQPPSPLLPLRRALSVHYSPHTRRYATQGTSNNNNDDTNDNEDDTSRHDYAQPRTGSPALSSSPSQLHLFTTLSPEQQTRHQSRRPPPASVEEHVLRATSTTTPGPALCSSSSSSLLVKSSSAAVYRRTYDSQEDHRATSLTTAPRLHDTTLTQSFSSSSLQQQQHERLQGTTTTTIAAGSVGRLTPQLSPAKTPSPPSPPLSRLLRQQQRGRTRSHSRYATPSMLRDASAARASPPPLSAATAPTPDKATTTTTTTDDEPHRLLHPSNNNNTLVMTSSMAEAPQTQQERHTMAEEEEKRTVKALSSTTHDDITIIPTTTTTNITHNMLAGDVLIQGDRLSTRREATLYDTHSTTTTTTHAASVWRRSTPLTAPSAFNNNNNKSYTSSFTHATNTAVIPDNGAVTQSSRHVTSSSATHQLPYRAVAVKVIYKADLAKPVFAEAAHNEVVMASQLHHPCLVNFFGIAEDKDYLLFVMDLSEKGNLRQYLERYGPRHTRRMAPRFLADVVLALEYFRDAQQHPYEPSHNVDDTNGTTTVSRKTNYHQQHYRTSTMPTTTTITSTAPVTSRASWESHIATSLRGTPVSCDEAQQPQHSAHTTNASTVATTTPVSGGGSHLLQCGDAAAVVAEGLCTDSSAEVTPHTLSPTAAAGQHSHANESQHHTTTLLHPISTITTTAQRDTVPEQTLTTTTASHPPNQPMQQQHNGTSTSPFASSLQEMAQAERQSALPPHPCSTITTSSNAEGPGGETESTVRHCRGIVLHRDLKPDNLTLTWDYHVKIGDFGSACFYEDDEGNRFAGSPAYISPEVILHDKAGPYSDLWAMGCILYELLEGRAAFAADTPFLLTQKIKHFEPDSLVFSSSTLSHHNNNNSNDDDEWFSEYEEEEEQRMVHARDLVRQLLQPVPEARLGSRERGGFATLKAHPFFASIDWSHVLTTSNLTMANTNYAHEIAEYLRANETLLYCSPVVRLEQQEPQQCNASPLLQQEEQQHETDSNGCHSGGNEASDETTKKKSSSTQGAGPMLLVLTSAPRLFLIDPLTSTVALTVPWSAAITVRGLSADCFALHLPATQDKSTTPVNVQHGTSAQEAMPCDGQEIVFRDLTRCAQRWVRHIEAWLKQEDYHNTMNGNETSSSSLLLGIRMSSSPRGEEGSSQTKAAAQQTHPTSTQRQQRRQSMSTTSHHSLLHHLRTAALAQLTQPAETTTGNYCKSNNTQGVCYCSGSSGSEGRNGVMSYASWRHHHRAQREATTSSSSSSLALHGGQSVQDRNAATMSEGVLASALRHGPRTPLYPLNATQS